MGQIKYYICLAVVVATASITTYDWIEFILYTFISGLACDVWVTLSIQTVAVVVMDASVEFQRKEYLKKSAP